MTTDDVILIISNKFDITTDFVVRRLHELSIPFIRLNTEDFPKNIEISIDISKLKKSVLISTSKQRVLSANLRSAWYRRPKMPNFKDFDLSRDDQIFAMRETDEFFQNLWYFLDDVDWVNNPHALAKAEMKALQLKIASDVGFTIPHTIFSNSQEAFNLLREVYEGHIVAKPISHGSYGMSDESAIFSTDLSNTHYDSELFKIETCPLIIQEKVVKESDIRLTAFGEEIFAYEIRPTDQCERTLDWRQYSPEQLRYERVIPPRHIVESVGDFMRYFGLKFGAFDFAVNMLGEWVFLEINPSGQFVWLEIATGDALIDALIRLLHGKN